MIIMHLQTLMNKLSVHNTGKAEVGGVSILQSNVQLCRRENVCTYILCKLCF